MTQRVFNKRSAAAAGNNLENFDNLPESGFARMPVLCGLFGVGPATIWRWSKERQDFPKPLKLSARVTAWKISDLRRHLSGQG